MSNSSDTHSKKLHELGVPLRNRTVDLLLTIHNSLGSLPGGGVATQLHPTGRLLRWPATGPETRGGATRAVSGWQEGSKELACPFRAGP